MFVGKLHTHGNAAVKKENKLKLVIFLCMVHIINTVKALSRCSVCIPLRLIPRSGILPFTSPHCKYSIMLTKWMQVIMAFCQHTCKAMLTHRKGQHLNGFAPCGNRLFGLAAQTKWKDCRPTCGVNLCCSISISDVPLALPSTVSSVELSNPLTHFAAHQWAMGEETSPLNSFHHHYLNMTLFHHMAEELWEYGESGSSSSIDMEYCVHFENIWLYVQ